MQEVYIPLVSAFFGAVIGTFGSVAVVLIQARKEDRRHRRETAANLALDSRNSHIEIVKGQGGGIFPIELYLAHSLAIIDALDQGGLTPEKLDELSAKQSELRAAILRNGDKPTPAP